MSIHFHPLKIREIRKETEDCISVSFDIPEKLRSVFAFTQGQSLTMRTSISGEQIRRTYSICSSPLENELRVAIKKLEGGVFSAFAFERLKPGDELEVMEPVGKFYTELNPNNKKHYLAFAAGSGITPVISIIKTTLKTEPQSEFTLVYGNRSRPSIIFFEELEALKNMYPDRFNLIIVLSRERTDAPINSGRINLDKLTELQRLINYKGVDEFFICGPEEMIFTVKEFLEQKGVEQKRIHFELFNTPGQKQQLGVRSRESGVNTGPKSKITVKLDGRSFDFELAFDDSMVILDAALKQGADLPYACKGGVCCTCKARLVEGEVEMDVHWGLEEEIEKGFILTCQSHPKTEKVKIDFDIR